LDGRKDIWTIRNPIPLIPRGFLLGQMEEDDPKQKRLIQVHVDKRPLKG